MLLRTECADVQHAEGHTTISTVMTGPRRNSGFCFPETLNVPRGELFSGGPVIKCFFIPPKSKLEKKNGEELVCFTPAGSQICSGFKEHDLIRSESKVYIVKHRRRWRRRGRRLVKYDFIFYKRNSWLSRSVQFANDSKNVLNDHAEDAAIV